MTAQSGPGAADRPSFATLADWLEGRLAPEAADRIATAVERGDPALRASVDWLRGFMRCADALPLRTPPPLVRQQLRQHFGRWSKAKAILEQPVVRLRAVLMFDSRMDRPLTAVRGVADADVIHLAYRSDLADLVLDVHPLPDGQLRLEGQVLPIEDSVAPVFEADGDRPGDRRADDRRRRVGSVCAEPGAGRGGGASGRQRRARAAGAAGSASRVTVAVRTELEVGDLLVGGTDAERLAHLRAEGLADESGLHWVMERAQELVHDDPRAAEALGRLCDQAAGELELTAVSAKVCYLQAQIVADRGDLEDGLRLIGLARDRWQQAGQPTAALRTDLGRMQILDDLGRHTEALAVGEGLLSGVEDIGPEQPDYPLARAVRAHAIDNMGTAYGLLGEHERALRAYAQAEREYRELGLIAEAARPQANRGVELLALGRAREALADLSSAIAGFLESGRPDVRRQVPGLSRPGPPAAR